MIKTRGKSAEKEKSLEPYIRLACGIFEQTRKEYCYAWYFVNKTKNAKKYDSLCEKKDTYNDYRKYKTILKSKNSVRTKPTRDNMFYLKQLQKYNEYMEAVKYFKKHDINKEPPKPTKQENDFVSQYGIYLKTIGDCELFYKSDWCKLLSLGKSIPGSEMINYLRKIAKKVVMEEKEIEQERKLEND